MTARELSSELVRCLLREQFPQWAGEPVCPVEVQGWDNRTFRVGDTLSVRLPSAEGYAAAVAEEQRWLPVLAPQLPVPIPVPLAEGQPGCGFPWPWSVYGWLPGHPPGLVGSPTPSGSPPRWRLSLRLFRVATPRQGRLQGCTTGGEAGR